MRVDFMAPSNGSGTYTVEANPIDKMEWTGIPYQRAISELRVAKVLIIPSKPLNNGAVEAFVGGPISLQIQVDGDATPLTDLATAWSVNTFNGTTWFGAQPRLCGGEKAGLPRGSPGMGPFKRCLGPIGHGVRTRAGGCRFLRAEHRLHARVRGGADRRRRAGESAPDHHLPRELGGQ